MPMSNSKSNKKKSASSKPSASKSAAVKNSSSKAHAKKKLTVAQRRELERQQKITQLLVIVGSLVVAFIVIIIFVLFIDNSNANTTDDYTKNTSSSASTLAMGVYPASTDYETAPDGEQLKAPEKGEEVAVFETSMGTIKIRLFPDYVPTTVENFKTLINEGYYNGVIFHRTINDFMIQGGMGSDGGKCAFEGYDSFQDEFGRNLYNIRGAVSMANAGTNTNSSQFFIVQSKEPVYSTLGDAEGFKSQGGAEWAADAYEKYGGTPYLDGQFKSITGSGHTVFGQVYEGMDVVDKIAGVETDGNDKPLEDVTIKKAYLEIVK